jgi:hypothetical protein
MSNQEHNYTLQEVIAIGEDAARTLESQSFRLAYAQVLNNIQDRFYKTEPGHSRTLEELRREGNALAKVTQMLQRYTMEARSELQKQSQQQQAAAERAGFGDFSEGEQS